MTLSEWKNDFKGFVKSLSMPRDDYKGIMEYIDEIPEPHWIPVEQDTPTEDDDYWCTFDAETGRFVDWCSWYQGRWVVWTDDTVSEVSNVIAWCKPIEPYKG